MGLVLAPTFSGAYCVNSKAAQLAASKRTHNVVDWVKLTLGAVVAM